MRLPVPFRTRFAAGLLAGAMLLRGAPCSAASYEPGAGLTLLDGRLNIGGYTTVEGAFLDDSRDQLVLDDLSSFITLHLTDNWLVFSELEIEEGVHLERGGFGTGHDVFSLERLYAEWRPGDSFRLRAGKMLTPFGIWNLIHAAPLVWTTSRPIATTQFFDTGVTGLEATFWKNVGAADLAFTLYGQATEQLNDPNDPQEARRAIGGRVEGGPAFGPRFGASAVRFRDHTDHRNETAFGFDALWPSRLFEASAEAAFNVPDSGSTTLAAYAQLVVHAYEPLGLHPFVRLEYADLPDVNRWPVVFGLAWRPTDTMIVKVEGILGGDDTELGGNGALTSFSVLF